ncbi:MAG: hypothetical protein EXS31_09645 [Pedosphaera sp.]|nr:hypothetical protein [Pedosphaera sp.]
MPSGTFTEMRIPTNLDKSVRIANWAYARDYERDAMTWVRAKEIERLPANWHEPLAMLVN